MSFDVARVRGLFPALGDGWVHLDAQAGMQVPDSVASTVATALRAPVSGPRGLFPSSQRGVAIVDAARRAAADVVGGDPAGVVLGPGRSELLVRLADALAPRITLGTDVVVSKLDDEANVAPWLQVADRNGATVRWAEIDIETCEIPDWQYDELVTEATRVVAVTAASNAVGTRPDVRPIADRVHAVGGLVVVDATSAAPFLPLDLEAMGADVVALCGSSWGGPPVGALVFGDPALLEDLPSRSLDPDARGPERLELGRHAHAMLAGLVASVEHLSTLDDTATGSRRARLLTSMASVKAYQAGLLSHLLASLRALPEVMVLGDPMRRVPMVSFTVADVPAAEVVQRLVDNGICAFPSAPGNRVFEALGVGEIGGAVQLGLAHYTTVAEVDQVVRTVASLG
jgi:cysteine desulfurase family protein (TIGR01976 family)